MDDTVLNYLGQLTNYLYLYPPMNQLQDDVPDPWFDGSQDPENLQNTYARIIADREQRGLIQKDPDTNKNRNKVHYLPQHAALKDSSTTPLCVVFDCSCKPKKKINQAWTIVSSLLHSFVVATPWLPKSRKHSSISSWMKNIAMAHDFSGYQIRRR